MKIYKIQVENFRLLKEFSIDVEDELSLVIGKNNTGKTSILSVLDKFLNHSDRNKFYYDDFNIDYKERLRSSKARLAGYKTTTPDFRQALLWS